MILDCIRHGITASNLAHRFNDCEDEPLLPEVQAALAGVSFPTEGYDLVHVSPLRRCVERPIDCTPCRRTCSVQK